MIRREEKVEGEVGKSGYRYERVERRGMKGRKGGNGLNMKKKYVDNETGKLEIGMKEGEEDVI